jgi:hypothetical protein
MPRRTYHQQVKQQKERARKARQDVKQQSRAARVNATDERGNDAAAAGFGASGGPAPETTP